MVYGTSGIKRKTGLGATTLFRLCANRLILPFLGRKPHILIACMPKSGSTFLTNLISFYPGIKSKFLLPDAGQREQEPCEIRLALYQPVSYVSQMHLKNSAWTQVMIERYRISPVVLTRNLLDCVASIRDHIRKENDLGALAFLPKGAAEMNDEALDMLIVQMAMPWYLSFLGSWQDAPNVLRLDYAEITGQPAESLSRVLSFGGITPDVHLIEKAVVQARGKSFRLNKGVSGRGASVSPAARERLSSMASFYPSLANDPALGGL